MSSAILYVAIVAIWAGVLIPRWLRRDSSAHSDGSGSGSELAGEDRTAAEPEPAVTEEPAPRSRRRPDAAPRDQEHKKVLAARRRLLGMLLVLVAGSGALAFTRLAAWWVVVPPVIMLLGYTALLREAAKSDTERRELARTREVAATAQPAAPPAAPAPAPGAEVIDISASLTPGEEKLYDQYADAKLRAVGDLARARTG